MNILDDYIRNNTLTSELILSLVDEWSLYIFYVSQVYDNDDNFELQLGKKISSPLPNRIDSNPSFSVYESNNEYYDYLWKDQTLNISGGVFKLIKEINGLKSYNEVYNLINNDFELGIGTKDIITNKVIKSPRPDSNISSNIRVKTIPFNTEGIEFWNQIGIDITSTRYKVKQVEFYWLNEYQFHPFKCTTLTFAYYEWSSIDKRYKIQLYSPYSLNKSYKFASDYDNSIVLGFYELEYNTDTLIITKSKKDIILLNELGCEAISGRSETTLIPEEFIKYLLTIYKRIIVWQDPDPSGWGGAYKYKELYNLELTSIYPCLLLNSKDISDYRKINSEEDTINLIKLLTDIRT